MSDLSPGVRRRAATAAAALLVAFGGTLVATGSAGSAGAQTGSSILNPGAPTPTNSPLSGPPAPAPGVPTQRPDAVRQLLVSVINTTVSTVGGVLGGVLNIITPPPATSKTWGGPGSATTLVLYDTTDTYGWLGELYGMAAGKPVLWAGDNIWQLSGVPGSPADSQFTAAYGWDPSSSWFDTADAFSQVEYKGQVLTRDSADQGGILAPHVTDPSKVSVLAGADCADASGNSTACASIAQTPTGATSVPWAIRSGNLTYVGEIPFAYMTESDRYLAYADLLFNADAPNAPAKHQALVRLEDVDPTSDPAQIRAAADLLSSQNVPFSVGVIPTYTDPNGTYDNGTPQTVTLSQAPAVVAALQYAQSKGGTIIEHGYTHQYSNIDNPYDGATGDDFEFYRSQCSTTNAAPYLFDAPCQNTDWVILEGPVPGDSSSWAANRALLGRTQMNLAGFFPSIWETPHYAASAADYAGIGTLYNTRYERELFFGGQLSGSPSAKHVFGQFFPYVVHDVYGSTVLPEDLGNYEPVAANNRPPRLPADIVANAKASLVTTQGVASFFFHPYYPLDQLQAIVSGIKGLGYTFVSPSAVASGA
jgi:uncharacterized protein YdaL